MNIKVLTVPYLAKVSRSFRLLSFQTRKDDEFVKNTQCLICKCEVSSDLIAKHTSLLIYYYDELYIIDGEGAKLNFKLLGKLSNYRDRLLDAARSETSLTFHHINI